MADLKSIVENGFTQYAGAVLQSRALIDVRDGLKPSARQIFYSMKLQDRKSTRLNSSHNRKSCWFSYGRILYPR